MSIQTRNDIYGALNQVQIQLLDAQRLAQDDTNRERIEEALHGVYKAMYEVGHTY